MTSHAQLRSHLQTRLALPLRRNTPCAAAPHCTNMNRLSATVRCLEDTAFCAAARHWRYRVPGYLPMLDAVTSRLRNGDATSLATARYMTPQRPLRATPLWRCRLG